MGTLFRRRHRLAPGLTGGAVLCSVALVTGVATQFAGTACAAVPPAGVVQSGEATFYDSGTGNCSYPTNPADNLYVALGPTEYAGSAACGGYLDVTGPHGSVRVKVVDQCPECAAGHLDLSREAFAQIADPVAGKVPVTFSAVGNPATPATLSVRVKEGSSAFWLALLIDNHGNPLTKVEVSAAGRGWNSLSRTTFNYWVFDSGLGAGPFTVRVTDREGRTATIPSVALSPGTVQQSTVSMSGGTSSGHAPSTPRAGRTTLPPAGSNTAPRAGASDSTTAGNAPLAAAADGVASTEELTRADGSSGEPIEAVNPVPSSSLEVPWSSDAPAAGSERESCG